MNRLVNGIVLEEGTCLLVKRGLTYIFPGGRPYSNENDQTCLARVFHHGLSGTRIKNIRTYATLAGKTHVQHREMQFACYLVDIDGDLRAPSGEVTDRWWINLENIDSPKTIAEMTRAVLYDLRDQTLLK